MSKSLRPPPPPLLPTVNFISAPTKKNSPLPRNAFIKVEFWYFNLKKNESCTLKKASLAD